MTGLIILAAGPSSRLGQPKQKMLFKGKSLLQHAVRTAIASECKPVIVVLGAYAEEIQPDIAEDDVIVHYNNEWEEGMASSIRAGIGILQKTAQQISDVILMVSDQPFVDAELLKNMINKKATTGKEIVACSYNNTIGVPVLFSKKFFSDLALLKGQDGAKKLLMKYHESVAELPFPSGSIDIDTAEDYETLITS